jgi:hypothetical protein
MQESTNSVTWRVSSAPSGFGAPSRRLMSSWLRPAARQPKASFDSG